MAKRGKPNRKKNQPRISFPSPLAAILLAVACLSLFYLWLCGRCEALGSDITDLEAAKEQVHRRVMNEQLKWTNMKAPGTMEQLLARHELHMILPPDHQVIRIYGTQGEGETPHQYAQVEGSIVYD